MQSRLSCEAGKKGDPSFALNLWKEHIVLSLFHRFTYVSWTMRCRIQMSAKGTSWQCMMEAARWRTWRPSSAAPWLTTWCCAQAWGWSACGRTRAAATAGFRCSSPPFKNVRLLYLTACPSEVSQAAWLLCW